MNSWAPSVSVRYRACPLQQKLFEQQSMETEQEKRKRLVWEVDRRLQEDQARPIVYYLRFATCWQLKVKVLKMMVNTSLTVGVSKTSGSASSSHSASEPRLWAAGQRTGGSPR